VSKFLLRDNAGRVLAIVSADPPTVEISEGNNGITDIGTWATDGIPATRGKDIGDVRVEVPTIIPPSDRLWGLALLEEVESRGWSVTEDGDPISAAEFDESKHARIGKGQAHGGQFAKHATADVEEERLPANLTLHVSEMEKIGGSLGGSTPAAQYKNANGDVWYVKDVKSSEHAKNEILAARLYALAGVAVPEIQLVEGGKVGSRVIKLLGSATAATPGAANGFAADAWLANWDAVGKGYDNLQIDEHGNAIRIDVGGSLLFRAQGGSKSAQFGDDAEEINSLRDPNGPNPQSSKVFSKLSADQVKDSINATVAKVTDAQISAIVNEYAGAGIDNVSPAKIKEILKARRDFLIKLAAGEKKSTVAKTEGEPDVKGKVFSMGKLPFGTSGYAELADIEQEKKPKLPSGPQMRAMKEASANAKKGFTTDNWDDAYHPRPDRDGVPTNKHSHEFQRLFSVGRSMCSAWKGSAQSEGASALKRAAIRVFNAHGIVYNNSSQDGEVERWDNDRAIRMMYRDTQERLAASSVSEHDRFVLFRGLHTNVVTAGVLEGHSLSQSAATGFNGHDVIKRWVPPVEILADNKSKYFEGTAFHNEAEWLVFAGGFGSPASEKASVKKDKTAPAAVAGIVDYSGGKGVKVSPALIGKIHKQTPVKSPSPAVSHEQAAKTGEVQAHKWAEVTDEKILKVKEFHAQGKSTSHIKQALNMAPSTIHGIVHGLTKKYAATGPRSAHMKKMLEVSQSQYDGIKQDAHAQLAQHGKVDFNAVGAKHGVKGWKAQAVFFQQKKAA